MRDCYALVLAAALLLPGAAAAQATNVNLGDLVLVVSDSPTAQVFHIVDQLSEWDQYAHKQYGRWAARALALTQDDRMLLRQHAALRRGRGWGKGFEQGFLVDATIERAAREAVTAGWLSAAEAASERAILEHFAPKLAPLLTEHTEGYTKRSTPSWRPTPTPFVRRPHRQGSSSQASTKASPTRWRPG